MNQTERDSIMKVLSKLPELDEYTLGYICGFVTAMTGKKE